MLIKYKYKTSGEVLKKKIEVVENLLVTRSLLKTSGVHCIAIRDEQVLK